MPTLVIEKEIRIPIKDEMRVILPPSNEWRKEYPNLDFNSYKVKRIDFNEAEGLANRLFSHYQGSERLSDNEIDRIFKNLLELRIPDASDKSSTAFWDMQSERMVDYAGPNKLEIEKLLASRCSGMVLEAMCGHTSYFEERNDLKVVALDFSEQALKRYPFPQRPRILFDINKDDFNQFSDKSFDCISVCFGFQYLLDPEKVCKGFRRILRPGGKVIFIENPTRRFEKAAYRKFSLGSCELFLNIAHFSKVYSEKLQIEDFDGEKNYYLIMAQK